MLRPCKLEMKLADEIGVAGAAEHRATVAQGGVPRAAVGLSEQKPADLFLLFTNWT